MSLVFSCDLTIPLQNTEALPSEITMTPALRDIRNGGVDELSDASPSRGDGPTKPTQETKEAVKKQTSVADRAHSELSSMLERCESHAGESKTYREAFPVACKSLLHSLPGNRSCVDCNARDPEWAAISYGALVCIKCSGKHRSMGVAVSQVRSVAMDHWTHKEVVLMLEGGNTQLGGFFARHALTKKEFEKQEELNNRKQAPSGKPRLLTADNLTSVRYKTKAALFYKNQLEAHVVKMLEDPSRKPYRGRSRSQTREDSEQGNQQQ